MTESKNRSREEDTVYRDYFCGRLHLTYFQACLQHNFIGKNGKFYPNCPPEGLKINW